MTPAEIDVDTWLEHAADPELTELDALLAAAFAGRSRLLWTGVFWGGSEQEIIGYGDLVQSRPRGPDVEWFVVGAVVSWPRDLAGAPPRWRKPDARSA